MVLANEVYTGAGLSATMIPEADFEISQAFGSTAGSILALASETTTNESDTLTWSLSDDTRLVVDLYKGCVAKLQTLNSSGALQPGTTQYLLIQSNIANKLYFGQTLSGTETNVYYCTILSYGAPVYAPATREDGTSLLSDNWLGLVNTITPPTVDAELKQVNLALGGTRNFDFQFKGAESLGEASIDVSLNNGMWLYYALGKLSALTSTGQGTPNLGSLSGQNGKAFVKSGTTKIYRVEQGVDTVNKILPTPTAAVTADAAAYKEIDADTILTYTFSENDTGDMPSFALEITNEKSAFTPYETDANQEKMFSRLFTGCQVQSFSLNFEEGQDVKASISAVSRKAQDSATLYVPKLGKTSPTTLFNYSSTDAANNPYMFSDGTIKIYGQTFAKIKSGTLTISNNLTPQRFIGQYDRTITSAHLAGQRTYELSLNMLITDRTVWDELRNQNETTADASRIDLTFKKDNSASDKIVFVFDNYITTSVDLPFPEDKGAMEVAVTVQSRTLQNCQYVGQWVIQP